MGWQASKQKSRYVARCVKRLDYVYHSLVKAYNDYAPKMRTLLKKKLAEMVGEMWTVCSHSFYQGMWNAVKEGYDKEYQHDVGAWVATMNSKGAPLVEELIPDKEVASDDELAAPTDSIT